MPSQSSLVVFADMERLSASVYLTKDFPSPENVLHEGRYPLFFLVAVHPFYLQGLVQWLAHIKSSMYI